MKRLLLTLLLLLTTATLFAQDAPAGFESFENTEYGITGIIPSDWSSVGFGIYRRNATPEDIAQLVIQAAPLSRDAIIQALLQQIQLAELPESSGQIEGASLTWDEYQLSVEAQSMAIAISLAIAEVEGKTYLVVLQSLADEHDELRESVFLPVVESIAPQGVVTIEPTITTNENVPYIVEDVTFTNGDVTLAGTLTMPDSAGQHPAVVLISGSGASNRNESVAPLAEIEPFAILADHLTRYGIAVLRYDDRGVGESTGDFATASLSDFAADASAAVDYLASRDDINPAQIGIIGHSEGGAIAPEVAINNDNVAFVVGLAAPAVNMFDILREQNRLIFQTAEYTEEQVNALLTAFDSVRDALATDDDAALESAVAAMIEAQTGEPATDELIQFGIAQLTALGTLGYVEYDITTNWSQVDVPVLAIYGGLDLQVSAEQNIPTLQETLANNPDVTVITIDEANHVFQQAETGSPNEYATLDQTMMLSMLDTLTTWILERVDIVE
jgi:pimeloyl-ACP methyl ester carboxylesterase